MKKLTVIVAIVLVVIAGTPWVFGSIARQRVTAGIERLDAEAQIEARVLESAGGWATSTTTIELQVPQSSLQDATLPEDLAPQVAAIVALFQEPLRLAVTMHHGPVLMGDGVSFGLASSTIRLDPATPGYEALLAELGIPYLFEIRSVTGFGGQSDFAADVPSFEYVNGDLTVAFSGSNTVGSYDAIVSRVEARGEAASLHVEAGGSAFDMEQVAFSSDSTRHNDLLRLGHAEASIAHMSASGPSERFDLDDFGVRFDVTLEDSGEHATMAGEYRFANFSDSRDIDVTGLELVATARRVDVDALAAYYIAAQEAGLSNDPAAPLSLELEDAVYDLLASSPVVDIAPIRLNWAGEPLDATVRIEIDGTSLPERSNFTAFALAFNGVASIEATLEISAELARLIAARGIAFQLRRTNGQDGILDMTEEEIETIAASQAAVTLAQLAAQGMLVSTGDGYATRLRFANGQLTVNDNVLPIGLP